MQGSGRGYPSPPDCTDGARPDVVGAMILGDGSRPPEAKQLGDSRSCADRHEINRARLFPYPHSYPQASRNPPEPAGAGRNTRTQPDSAGGLPRFRYAVPALISGPDLSSDRAISLPVDSGLNPYLNPHASMAMPVESAVHASR